MPVDLQHPLTILAVIAGVFFAVFVAYSLVEARLIRVRRDTVGSADLPLALDGLRIVFVSDIHAGPYLRRRGMDRLVARLNALEPDVLLLGGDYVGGEAHGARWFYPAIAHAQARLCKIAVLGNHDVWEGAGEARAGLAAAGFTLLENANVDARTPEGATLFFGGVEDFRTGHPDVGKAALGIEPGAFAVLVSHNPDVFATQLESTCEVWDLALSGHTHGGQVTLFGGPGLTRPSHYGFHKGWSKVNGVDVLVSAGAGTVTLPLRFFARPEIHVITVRAAGRASAAKQTSA